MLDWLADNWDQPEEGIWETRGGRKDFTYGRVMCWVAFDRAIRLATKHGPPGPAGSLDRRARRDLRPDHGEWLERRNAAPSFSTTATEVLDSSLLRMATVGFIAPRDPLWPSTLDAMDDELVTDSLVYRYDPAASPDGLQGSEGTFSLCTFNYVDALARAGRLDEARLTFEKMLTYANHLGLYSEEIALDRRADRQLPAGVHPPRPDRRRDHPGQRTQLSVSGERARLVPWFHHWRVPGQAAQVLASGGSGRGRHHDLSRRLGR